MIYELKLTKQGMDIILAALAELPYKQVGALIDECMKQWTAAEAAEAEKQKAAVLAQAKEAEAANKAADSLAK